MTSVKVKTKNLSCRVSPEHKVLIERAARKSGETLSDFILHSVTAAAFEVLSQPSVIHLTAEEWRVFATSLDEPAREPGPATKKAVELFKMG